MLDNSVMSTAGKSYQLRKFHTDRMKIEHACIDERKERRSDVNEIERFENSDSLHKQIMPR